MKKTILIVLGVVIIVIILGGGLWYMQKNKQPENNNTSAAWKSVSQKSNDSKRKSDLREISAALELYYSDHGLYPKVKNMDSCLQLLIAGKYLEDKTFNDPLSPNQEYRYGVSADGLYYRMDTRLELKDDTSPKNDGGIDPALYEVGTALRDKVTEVNCMNNCILS